MKNSGFVIGWLLAIIVIYLVSGTTDLMTWLLGLIWVPIWFFSNWKFVKENQKIFIRNK